MSKKAQDEPYSEKTVYEVPMSSINVDEQMLREHVNDDDIIELATSISRHGLWNPITLRATDDDKFELVAGRRRLTAFVVLGRTHVPAIILAHLKGPIKGLALVENIQRRDLTLEEECSAITYLHTTENLSPDQISDIVGKTRSWVLRRLAIPGFPPRVVEALLESRISLGAAEAISTVPSESLQEMLINSTVQSKLTVAQVGAAVEMLKTVPSVEDSVKAGLSASPEQKEYVEPELECMACHGKAPVSELIMVRVHKNGCPE